MMEFVVAYVTVDDGIGFEILVTCEESITDTSCGDVTIFDRLVPD